MSSSASRHRPRHETASLGGNARAVHPLTVGTDPGRLARAVFRAGEGTELPKKPEHVDLAVLLDDLAVGEAFDIDAGRRDRSAGRRPALPLPEMRAAARPTDGDLVVLGHQVIDGDAP